MTALSEIPAVPVAWLLAGLVPMADCTIIAGAGGISKGTLIADWAARISTGRPMPGESGMHEPAGVAIVSGEDTPATVAMRVKAAGGDLAKVHLVGGPDFTLPDSLPALRAELDAIPDLALIVLDPLSALCSRALTSNMAARAQLRPLQRLAAEYGAAVVAVHHVVKSGAIAGSQAITDLARSVLRVTLAEDDPRIRVVTLAKSNLASLDRPPLRYSLAGEDGAVSVRYLERDLSVGPAQRRILLALAAAVRPMSAPEIALRSQCSAGAVRVHLVSLSAAGKVARTSRGRYVAATGTGAF